MREHRPPSPSLPRTRCRILNVEGHPEVVQLNWLPRRGKLWSEFSCLPPPNAYAEILIPKVMVSGSGAFGISALMKETPQDLSSSSAM